MSFEVGKTVAGYEFIDILNNSKSGVVYKVRNVKFGRLEMLRILPRGAKEDQERVDRFLREVKVHARLSHSNIISFYDVTEIEGQLVMTMELVEGVPLASRLETGSVSCREAIDYACQVLSALGYAHRQGVVHRDVTPANILVTPENRAMLGGFGMAKAATDPNLTQTGTAIGVAEYMSPEQVKGVSRLDPRADIYSLGVVLFEAVTGTVPFKANSQFEVMLAHVNNTPKVPSSINSEVPADLDQVILKALEKEPGQRFQTATEFSEALSKLSTEAKPHSAAKTVSARVEQAAPRAEAARAIAKPGNSKLDTQPAHVRVFAAAQKEKATIAPAKTTPAFAPIEPLQTATAVLDPIEEAQNTPAEKKSGSREWSFSQMVVAALAATVVLTLIFSGILALTGALPLTH
jgi:serine/threonine-protein kinase